MYQVDPSQFTSKSDPKKEFKRYFKNTGASAAFQKAMILLYRMPVKPENIVEFLSEYFEDGAQKLMRISLLKAELCYKKDELEKFNEKVKASEEIINGLVVKLGLSEKEFNERFMPDEILENERISILERYFKDMEREAGKNAEPHLPPDDSSIVGDDPKAQSAESETDYYIAPDEDRPKTNPYDVDLHIVKELDPWGIICRVPALQQVKRSKTKSKPKASIEESGAPGALPIKSDFSIMNTQSLEKGNGSAHVELDGEVVHDDDDVATLADDFQQFAFDLANLNQDEGMVRLHHQLLAVKKADPVKLADLMAWKETRSKEDISRQQSMFRQQSLMALINDPDKDHSVARFASTSTPELEDTNSSIKPLEGNLSDIDRSRRNPCPEKPEEESDAFLFEDIDAGDLVASAYRMVETNQGFIYEFPEYAHESVKHERGACRPVANATEYENCSVPPTVDFLRGETVNSSRDRPDSSPGAGLPARRSTGADSKGEVPIMRVDSSCHCILKSPYSASELYDDSDDDPTEPTHKIRTSDSKKKSFDQGDEVTIAEDAALAKELDEVFKKNRRRSSVKGGAKNKKDEEVDDEVQANGQSDIYAVVDLAKEIRRTMLGPNDSKVVVVSARTSRAPSPDQNQKGQGDHKNMSKPKPAKTFPGPPGVLASKGRKTPPTHPNDQNVRRWRAK